MRRRARLATSAACGALALMLAAAYAESARAEVRAERSEVLERYGGEVASLVVAREELLQGDVVTEADVEVREWLVDLAPAGSLSSVGDVVGMRLTSSVAAGSPLTELDFAGQDGAIEVPEGRVAVSARLGDRSGVPAEVPAGSRVLAYEDADGAVRLLSSDVVVLAAPAGTSRSSSERSITLAALPGDVMALLASGSAGTLRIAVPAEDVATDELGGRSVARAPTTVEAEGGAAAGEGQDDVAPAGEAAAARADEGDADGPDSGGER